MHHTLFREVKMSDYDDDFMAEDEDYDLEYSDGDSNDSGRRWTSVGCSAAGRPARGRDGEQRTGGPPILGTRGRQR